MLAPALSCRHKRLAGSSRQLGAALVPQLDTPSLLLAAEQAQQSRSRSPSLQTTQPGSASTESPKTPVTATDQQGRGRRQASQPHSARLSTGAKRDRSGRAPAAGKRVQQAASAAASAQDSLHQGAQEVGGQSCSFQELDQKLRQYVQLQHAHLVSLVSFVVNTLSQTQLALAFVGAYPFAPDFMAIAAAASTALTQRQQHKLQQEQQAVLKREALGGGDAAAAEAAAVAAATGAPAAPKRRARKGRKKAAQGQDTSPGLPAQVEPVGAEPSQVQAPLLQCVTQKHVQQRYVDLQQHQQLCWAELEAVQPPQPCDYQQLVPMQQQQHQQQQEPPQMHLPQVHMPQVQLEHAQLQQLCSQPMQQQEPLQAHLPQPQVPQMQLPQLQLLLAPNQQQYEAQYSDALLQHQQQHVICNGGIEQHSHLHQEQHFPNALLQHQQQAMCNDDGAQHIHQHQEHGMDVWLSQGGCSGLPGHAPAAPQASAMDVDF